MSKAKLYKIENGEKNTEYGHREVIKVGGEMWGEIFDRFEGDYYSSRISTMARRKFIQWAQDTLCVCPCPGTVRNLYSYRNKEEDKIKLQ